MFLNDTRARQWPALARLRENYLINADKGTKSYRLSQPPPTLAQIFCNILVVLFKGFGVVNVSIPIVQVVPVGSGRFGIRNRG